MSSMIIGIGLILSVGYWLLQLTYLFLWLSQKKSEAHVHSSASMPLPAPELHVLVCVPARNEAEGISICLDALAAQTYPKHFCTMVVINDHSTDATAQVVQGYAQKGITLLHMPEGMQGKKAALAHAIAQFSEADIIVTTDADCSMSPLWLETIALQFEQNAELQVLAAPVVLQPKPNVFEWFQALDFAGMMLITAAGIRGRFQHMANGANLAYRRSAYQEVNGFAGIDQIASGDDMLLMQKIAKAHPKGISFLKSRQATVQTPTQSSIASFWQQRIRWGSKGRAYPQPLVNVLLLWVWLFCVYLLLISVAGVFGYVSLFWLLVFWGIKCAADLPVLAAAASFFGKGKWLLVFLPAQLIHVIYISSVGLMANLVKQYRWKGRAVR